MYYWCTQGSCDFKSCWFEATSPQKHLNHLSVLSDLKTGFFSEQHQRFRAGRFWWLWKNAKYQMKKLWVIHCAVLQIVHDVRVTEPALSPSFFPSHPLFGHALNGLMYCISETIWRTHWKFIEKRMANTAVYRCLCLQGIFHTDMHTVVAWRKVILE